MYSYLADAVLGIHACFVVFVVVLVPLIFCGGAKGWRWVRQPWLRWFHLLGIVLVVVQSWLGLVCPLTTLEMWLRSLGRQAHYTESFIEYWLQGLLYWHAPWWVFVAAYTVFGAIVISTWFFVPPRRFGAKNAAST